MRIWSALDFIPKALAFERARADDVSLEAARRWTSRSRLRMPLDLATLAALLMAFRTALHGTGI
jgi:hypothetical protein